MDPLAALRALDAPRVLRRGDDVLWDRVFALRPDVDYVELDVDDYPTVFFVETFEPASPFPLPSLTGPLERLLRACWEEEGERRDALACQLLSGDLSPEVVDVLARGGFPWEVHELSVLARSGFLTPLHVTHLVYDLDEFEDEVGDQAGGYAVLRPLFPGLVDLVLSLRRALPGSGPGRLVELCDLLSGAAPEAVEAFLVLRPSWRGSDAECLLAASRL